MTTNNNNNPPNQSNQNQQQNTAPAAPRPNPFSGGGSRLGGGSSAGSGSSGNSSSAPASPFGRPGGTTPSGGSPFGGFRRTNENQVQWTVLPLQKTVVRLQLSGLGDPFHRLLGLPLNTEYGTPQKVVQALQDNAELKERLLTHLNTTWESYQFRGAALCFAYNEEVRKAYTQPWQPVTPPPSRDDDDDSDDSPPDTPPPVVKYTLLRAIDVALVLNLLARQRAQLIVAGTPLALETAFLEQVLLTDDPRITALALATGSIEEVWQSG